MTIRSIILTPTNGRIAIVGQYYICNLANSEISSQLLYLHYRRAQLKDEGLLSQSTLQTHILMIKH